MPRIGGQIIPHKTVLLIASEGVLILCALFLATVLRLLPTSSPWPYLASMSTIYRFAMVALICEISFYYNDLYDLTIVRSRLALSVHLLQALGVSSLILGIAYFVDSRLSPGRGIAIVAAPTILILVLCWRSLLDSAGIGFGKRERVLIVGTGPVGRAVAKEVRLRPEYHCDFIGYLGEQGVEPGDGITESEIIGYMPSLQEVVVSHKIDRIILSLQERRGRTPVNELLHLKFRGVAVDDPHSFLESITGRILLDYLSPSWFILSHGFRKSRLVLTAKRLLDLFLASILMLLAVPVLALTAVAIACEDGFPVLFRQPRIGLGGRRFSILKFRSMRRAPEGEAPSWTGDGDSRITRVGSFIRKYRIDELPQLINVLRGDMSLVGPRPEQPYFCEVLDREIPYYSQRHSVRPGITGWAQIKFRYGATVEDSQAKLELDLFYIKHLSCFLDLAIMLETVKVVLFGRGSK